MATSPCAIPLVVGVACGPLEDGAAGAVGETLGSIFRDLRGAYPHTPLLLLSTEPPEARTTTHEAARAQQVEVQQDRSLAQISLVSDILVVITDESASAPKEVSAVVARREIGHRTGGPGHLLDPLEVATTYEVVIRKGMALVGPLPIKRIYPPRFNGDGSSEADFRSGLARLDRFNEDIVSVPVPVGDSLPSEKVFAAADGAANALQRRFLLWQRVLYAFAFAAAAAQVVGACPAAFGAAFASAKIVAAVGVVCAYVVVRQADYQNRYQDYRALSEGLRVESAWTHGGVSDSVDNGYLRMQQTELKWIRTALRTVSFLQAREVAQARNTAALCDWVEGQREYYLNASALQNARNLRFGRFIHVMEPINVIAGVAFFIGLISPKNWSIRMSMPFHDGFGSAEYWLGVLAGVAALTIALLISYVRARAFSEHANRYQRMYLLFDQAYRLLQGPPELDETTEREVARQLGREALAEHAEWLLTQRERPISVVYTGAT
jgi:hypothetical protein